jgi:two-component system, response regulator FlrC
MSQTNRILVVEDDFQLREAVCETLEFAGFEVDSAEDGVKALKKFELREPNLVVTDLQMDAMDGMELIAQLKAKTPNLPIIMVTAHGSVKKAVEAMQTGASDFLLKPFQAEVLLEMVVRLLESTDQPPIGREICVEDAASRSLYRIAKKVATTDATVLLQGESGTGKEVLSRFIHENSARSSGPFVAINCAAIPEQMLESMLFGYEKGAYTGAYQARPGKFEQANGGTILLDEISEMDLGLQSKLLRVLQEKEVERLGGQKLISLDARVLATTNRDLKSEVREGNFREDLYYRLSVFPLTLPPLRDRSGDILPLARQVLLQTEGPNKSFSEEAEQKILAHQWPGNVRELENAIKRAAILAETDLIDEEDLVFELEMPTKMDISDTPAETEKELDGNLKAHEQNLIIQALDAVGGSRKDAAEKLGISPRTLRYKLARLRQAGIPVPAANS